MVRFVFYFSITRGQRRDGLEQTSQQEERVAGRLGNLEVGDGYRQCSFCLLSDLLRVPCPRWAKPFPQRVPHSICIATAGSVVIPILQMRPREVRQLARRPTAGM